MANGFNSRRTLAHLHDSCSHQGIPFGNLPVCEAPRCDQLRESNAGCSFDQRQARRRNPCLFARRNHTHAERAARTGRNDLRGRGFTGVREQVLISQSFWRGHLLDPKTRLSKAPVPVIAQLAHRLDCHRTQSGSPANGLIFPSQAGKPINLDALAADVKVPAFTKVGIRCHGWHAFRRGLATNLHRLRVSDKTIQRIFRHSNVAVLRRRA